jgi:hypothetical protein
VDGDLVDGPGRAEAKPMVPASRDATGPILPQKRDYQSVYDPVTGKDAVILSTEGAKKIPADQAAGDSEIQKGIEGMRQAVQGIEWHNLRLVLLNIFLYSVGSFRIWWVRVKKPLVQLR